MIEASAKEITYKYFMDPISKQQFYTYDTPFKKHFEGIFDSVFIGFFPFFKILKNDAQGVNFKKSERISLEEARTRDPIYDKIQAANAVIYSKNQNYPGKLEILEYGYVITWDEIKIG